MQILTLPLSANCHIINTLDGKCVLIDPGSDGDAILRATEMRGLTPVAILFTHMHFDHIMAANEINSSLKTPLPMYIHSGDKHGLTVGMLNLSTMATGKEYKVSGEITPLYDGEILRFGNTALEVLHTPGHTPGSVCFVSRKDGIIFSGDTLFKGTVGRMDFPGGNPSKMKESLDKLTKLDENFVLYPGHGQTTTLSDEIKNNPYLNNDYQIF